MTALGIRDKKAENVELRMELGDCESQLTRISMGEGEGREKYELCLPLSGMVSSKRCNRDLRAKEDAEDWEAQPELSWLKVGLLVNARDRQCQRLIFPVWSTWGREIISG